MNLDKLKSLMFVAERGSLTAASEVVHLTQSAISQHLKDLEEELGVVLIDRSRRPLSLTKEGKKLVEVTRQMLSLWENYENSNRKTPLRGELILGHVSSAITGVVANALNVVRTKYPELTIKLVNTGGVSKRLAQEVLNRKVDASFGVEPLPLSEELLWKPYCLEQFYVIASKGARGKTDQELLRQGPYLRFKPTFLKETNIDREIQRRGIEVKPIFETDAYENILLMVEHGVGIGIVPNSYLSREKVAKLYCVAFGRPPLTRQMGLTVRHDNHNLYIVEFLCRVIKDLLPSY